MAVFVYSTGSIFKNLASVVTFFTTINNRNTTTQSYRVIVWDTNPGLINKQEIGSFTNLISPNDTVLLRDDDLSAAQIAMLTATQSIELEFRFSNPHIAPQLEIRYTSPIDNTLATRTVFAGEMFQDSTEVENP